MGNGDGKLTGPDGSLVRRQQFQYQYDNIGNRTLLTLGERWPSYRTLRIRTFR